jgi:hypothetical protein
LLVAEGHAMLHHRKMQGRGASGPPRAACFDN